MVYAGKKGQGQYTLGVSGRLMDENLVMWDEETGSLWSQILGKGLQGDAEGVELDMLPAIFVGMGTWHRMHPDSKVLNLSTVRAKPWYYTSHDLARGSVRGRAGVDQLGVGLRRSGDTLGVPLSLVHAKGVVSVEVGGMPLIVVWQPAEEAVLVYQSSVGGVPLSFVLADGVLAEKGGDRRWNAALLQSRGE